MTSPRSSVLLRLLGGFAVAGLVLTAVAVPAQAATKKPPVPKSVKAKATSTTVTVTWKSGKGSTTGFNVYRATKSKVTLSKPLNGKKKLGKRTTSFRATGLTPSKSYWFVVQAVGSKGKKSQAKAVKVTTLPKAPSAAALTATAGDTTVALAWQAGTAGGSATSWAVYRSVSATVSVSTANLVKSLPATARSYQDAGRANGTTYRYVVVGSNAGGRGVSNVVTAAPVAPPTVAPGAAVLSASPGHSSVALTWTAASGVAATSWKVYRSTTPTVDTTATATPITTAPGGTTTYTDTGLVDGTTYYFSVLAVNSVGGTPSNTVAATPTSHAPGVPTLSAVGGPEKVDLQWSATGTYAPTSWKVYRSTTAVVDTTGSAVSTKPAGTTTFSDVGRVNGTTYYYVVVAVNGDESTPSATVSATPVSFAPGKPTLSAVAGGGEVDLEWAATGANATTRWDVYRSTSSPVDPNTATTIVNDGPAGTTSVNDPALLNGTTYYYLAVASNANGSARSVETAATPSSTPAANLVVINPDGVVGSDRFVMSRMEYYNTPSSLVQSIDPDNGDLGTDTWYRLHDVAVVHVVNSGTAPMNITGLTISDTGSFTTTVSAPTTIAAGSALDVPVRFVYKDSPTYGPVVRNATLTITADGLPDHVAQLAGEWQPGASREPGLFGAGACSNTPPEVACARANFEATFAQIVNGSFGFGTNVGSLGNLNSSSADARFGDEVSSRFWQAADPTHSVQVTRLASFSGAGVGAVNWYPSSQPTGCASATAGGCQTVFSRFKPPTAVAADSNPATAALSQGLLPLQIGDSQVHSFSPGAVPFGLQLLGEFSDNTRNSTENDLELGHCPTAVNCGQHVRFFPVKTGEGTVVPAAYLVTVDLSGLNLDYNDLVVLVTNVAPAS